MSCKQFFTSIAAMTLMATVAFAESDVTTPDTPAYGSMVLDYANLGIVGDDWGSGVGLAFNDLGGNSFSFGNVNAGWGGEACVYYAFEVPTGSAVSVTGGTWQYNNATTSYWGESLLWSLDDIDAAMPAGATVMSKAIWDASYETGAKAGAANRTIAYADGYDWFSHGGSASDLFDAVWNYASNVQHFGTDGSGLVNNGGAAWVPTIRGGTDSGFTAWGSSPGAPTTGDNISDWTYTGVGSLDRCMQDPDAPASGFPEWMVTAGSGATTQGIAMLKMGGGKNNLLTVADYTIEIRGPGDANGEQAGTAACDVSDLGILATNYGTSGKTWVEGDFNGDGNVNVSDLGILATNYGNVYTAPAAAVPEPSIVCLLGLGSLAMLLIRRR